MKSDTSEPRLVPKREINPATGAASINYFWDEHLAPKVEISGKLVDKLSGYTLIKKDLDNALKWMKLAEKLASGVQSPEDKGYVHMTDRETFDVIKAYFVAALTFYGKCFTEAAGRHANASRDWLDVRYRDLHDSYMSYRHNFAAHSGNERFELATTYVLLHPNRRELLPYLPTIRLQPDLALPSPGELGLADLIEHVATKVTDKYNKLSQKIIHDFIIPAGVVHWCSAADKGEPVVLSPPKLKGKG